MSRTYRRKNYRPAWVTEGHNFQLEDRNNGVLFWVWHVEIQDSVARKKRINWWHADKKRQHWYSPCKGFRKELEVQHRMDAKKEIYRYLKNENHEVYISGQKRLPWWD